MKVAVIVSNAGEEVIFMIEMCSEVKFSSSTTRLKKS